MGFFDFLKGPDINQGVKEYSVTDGAVLLDVRTPDEYRQGHIPGSKNVPLQSIDKVTVMINNKATPSLYTVSVAQEAVRQLLFCSRWVIPM